MQTGVYLTIKLDRNVAAKHCLQLTDLILILTQKCVLWIFIDLRSVLDVLGTVGIPQRAQGLVVVVVGRRQTCHHQRLRIAAKRVLQHSRQFGIAVRNVLRLAVNQSRDNITKSRQRQIYLCCFLQPIACRPYMIATTQKRSVQCPMHIKANSAFHPHGVDK